MSNAIVSFESCRLLHMSPTGWTADPGSMQPSEAQAVVAALGAPFKAPRKKPAALTPKSLALLRSKGWQAAVVEHWNSFVRIRQDLFGWCDVLGVGKEGTIAVQVCRRSDMSTRARKIADSDTVAAVRDAGWRICVHGWSQDKAGRWQVKIQDLS